MTAVFLLLEKFVFRRQSLFIFNDWPDKRRHGQKYRRASFWGFMENEASVSVCGVPSYMSVLSFLCPQENIIVLFFSIGNKGFWERKSNKSGGCGLWN